MIHFNKNYTNITVNKLTINKVDSVFNAFFSFTTNDKQFSVEMSGIRDIENLTELFDADGIWITVAESSQLEYGKYTLGIRNESYCEVFFDVLS